MSSTDEMKKKSNELDILKRLNEVTDEFLEEHLPHLGKYISRSLENAYNPFFEEWFDKEIMIGAMKVQACDLIDAYNKRLQEVATGNSDKEDSKSDVSDDVDNFLDRAISELKTIVEKRDGK